MRRYGNAEAEFLALGGYAAESEAASIASSLGLPDRVLDQPLGTLSGGQRRRVELARILFSGAETLLLDEPTNHLDADSIVWLRDFLKAHSGGLIVISHDVDLLEATVNRVFHLDANRVRDRRLQHRLEGLPAASARPTSGAASASAPTPRRRPTSCSDQADRMRAKATKAKAAQNMARRAERLLGGLEETRRSDKVAKLRFPTPAPCGKTPLSAQPSCRSPTARWRSSPTSTSPSTRAAASSSSGLNGAGKTTLLRILAGVDAARHRRGRARPRAAARLLRAGARDARRRAHRAGEHALGRARPASSTEMRKVLGSFLFTGDDVDKPAGVLSGGEKTRLALATLVVSAANVLLLDEPTNNLDPASREEILGALRTYEGAVVLVTHDEGAVEALDPERVLLLPDGVEDLWSPDYADLVALA